MEIILKLKYEIASLEYTCESIAEFFDESQSLEFQEYICKLYPTFDLGKIKKMEQDQRLNYIKQEIEDLYNSELSIINERVNEYQEAWDKIDTEILKCYQSIFNIDMDTIFEKFTVQVGLNPICPRYLSECKFDCYYKLNAQSATENTIHELTHFVWFKIWEEVFEDFDRLSFEYPNIIWIFSEIAIDPILRDWRFKKYCTLEKPAYDYFYNIEINKDSLIKNMRDLYSENTIQEFMIKGLSYCERYRDILNEYI